MSVDGKIKVLTESLDQQIDWFSHKQLKSMRYAFWLKMAATLSGAATTVLLGLQGIEGKFLGIDAPLFVKNTALVLSAMVTLFITWDAFFNHRALWVRYTQTTSQLKEIKSELAFLSSSGSENIKEEEVDRLYKNYQFVMEQTNTFLTSLRGDGSKDKS